MYGKGNIKDGLCIRHVEPCQFVVVIAFYIQAETVIVLLLFPRVTGHQVELALAYGESVVQVGLEGLLTSEVSVAASLTVLVADTLELRLAGVVSAIGALIVAPRVVHVPEESLPELE